MQVVGISRFTSRVNTYTMFTFRAIMSDKHPFSFVFRSLFSQKLAIEVTKQPSNMIKSVNQFMNHCKS